MKKLIITLFVLFLYGICNASTVRFHGTIQPLNPEYAQTVYDFLIANSTNSDTLDMQDTIITFDISIQNMNQQVILGEYLINLKQDENIISMTILSSINRNGNWETTEWIKK